MNENGNFAVNTPHKTEHLGCLLSPRSYLPVRQFLPNWVSLKFVTDKPGDTIVIKASA